MLVVTSKAFCEEKWALSKPDTNYSVRYLLYFYYSIYYNIYYILIILSSYLQVILKRAYNSQSFFEVILNDSVFSKYTTLVFNLTIVN